MFHRFLLLDTQTSCFWLYCARYFNRPGTLRIYNTQSALQPCHYLKLTILQTGSLPRNLLTKRLTESGYFFQSNLDKYLSRASSLQPHECGASAQPLCYPAVLGFLIMYKLPSIYGFHTSSTFYFIKSSKGLRARTKFQLTQHNNRKLHNNLPDLNKV